MDKHQELNKLFDEIESVIKSADKTTYSEHWEEVEEHIRRAAFIVWNFDRPIDNLNAQLDKEQAGAKAFSEYLKKVGGKL